MSFGLLNPVVASDRSTCAFDLVAGESLLADGTEALMRACLQTIGVRAEPRGWVSRRFCSPYVSDRPDSDDPRDRNPLAWRVEVALDPPPARARVAAIMRYEVGLADATWKPAASDRTWDGAVAVVIATFTRTGWSQVAGWPDVLRDLPRVEVVRWDPGLVQARFELGPVRLPDDEPRIREAVEACLDMGGAVTWQDTLAGRHGR